MTEEGIRLDEIAKKNRLKKERNTEKFADLSHINNNFYKVFFVLFFRQDFVYYEVIPLLVYLVVGKVLCNE